MLVNTTCRCNVNVKSRWCIHSSYHWNVKALNTGRASCLLQSGTSQFDTFSGLRSNGFSKRILKYVRHELKVTIKIWCGITRTFVFPHPHSTHNKTSVPHFRLNFMFGHNNAHYARCRYNTPKHSSNFDFSAAHSYPCSMLLHSGSKTWYLQSRLHLQTDSTGAVWHFNSGWSSIFSSANIYISPATHVNSIL